MATKHVIIGNGPAGMHAIETIRKYDPTGSDIHLISNEPAYSRMVIPYWMAGSIDESHVLTATEGWYSKNRVTPHIGRRVTSVNPQTKKIILDGVTGLDFDTLLIATGSSATKPPVPGTDLPGVHNLWTMDDARAVMARAAAGQKVLFVGAGFIGFIILNALFKRGCKLAVVEVEKQILPRMLDAASATLATKWLGSKGVEVFTGTSVTGIEASGPLTPTLSPEGRGSTDSTLSPGGRGQGEGASSKLVAKLGSGQTVEADAVVVATGIKPNIGFLAGSGIASDKGVLVDQHLRTNFPHIYAAGDCAQGPDLLDGQRTIHAIQPTAIDHGRIAGANMAGRDVAYDGSLSMNVLDICGLQTASFGRWSSTGEAQTVVNETRPIFRKLLFDGDRIDGAILLGQTSDLSTLNDMGMIKGFIQTKTALGEWKGYLQHHPLDVRRAYIACGVATKLLNKTLLPEPTDDLGYRHHNAKPDSAVDRGPHHKLFADTLAAVKAGSA